MRAQKDCSNNQLQSREENATFPEKIFKNYKNFSLKNWATLSLEIIMFMMISTLYCKRRAFHTVSLSLLVSSYRCTSLNKHLFSDCLNLQQHWMTYNQSSKFWPLQHPCSHMIIVPPFHTQLIIKTLQFSMVTQSPFAIFFDSYPQTKSVGKPGRRSHRVKHNVLAEQPTVICLTIARKCQNCSFSMTWSCEIVLYVGFI